jgi:2-methylcitrate dehydratase PrpD
MAKPVTTTALETFGAFLARLRADDLPPAVTDKLALHVIDVVGAWIAGARTAEGKALIAFRECPGQGNDDDRSRLDDVATNCALARLSEVDDIHLASMTTAGSIVIPGALTIARSLPDIEAGALTAAIVGGYEAMVRLGLALDGPAILYRGIWPTYFAAPLGLAAVAARLLKLGEPETAHALALALTLASPGVGHHNAPTTSRWLAAGNAARNGLTAALAAQSGFTADLKIFESGFVNNVYGITPRAAALTDGLGTDWMLPQVSFKPWCAARQTMAATQGLREILDTGVAPGEIAEIRAAVLPPHLKMIDHGVTAGDRASHLTSVQYQMAIAALAPDRALDVGRSPNAIPESVRSFMGRIKVAGDDALLADYPSAWPARIIVVTRSGTRERLVTHVPGDPARPFSTNEISAKFHKLVAPVTGPQRSHDLLQRVVDGMGASPLSAQLIDEIVQICRYLSRGGSR